MIAEQISAPEDLAAVNTIPASWKSAPLAALFRRRRETGYGDLMPLSVFRDYGVIPRERGEDNYNRLGDNLESYQRVEPRDLVLNKMKTWQGSLGVSSLQGIVSPAYIVCEPTHSQNDRFLHYLLRSQPYVLEYQRRSYGVRVDQWDLRLQDFKTIPCLLPPIDAQTVIADYLDKQTQTIDDLIAKKQRLIELLEEKRTALITQAVTKGLDPDVPMKDSGVEWLGEIPEHWDTSGFAWVVDVKEGPGILARDFEESGVPLLRIGNLTKEGVRLVGCNFLDPEMVKRKWAHFRVEAGDLLISGSATSGEVSKVGPKAEGAIPYTGIMRLRPDDTQLDRGFLNFFLSSPTFLEQVEMLRTGVAIQHYGPTHLKQVSIPVPPLQEQRKISARLSVEEEPLLRTVAKTRSAIEKLREYRSALITAAVTGKIDVRDHAA